jgi:tRNA-dependent cyclodipeptide synthase
MLKELKILSDSYNIKYSQIIYSAAYTDREIIRSTQGLVKMVLVKTENGNILVLVPPQDSIDFVAFKKHLGVKNAKVLKGDDAPHNILLYHDIEDKTPSVFPITTFIPEGFEHQDLLVLHEHTYTDVLQLPQKEFTHLMKPKTACFLVPKRYKAKLRYASPVSAKKSINNYRKCILGFSMENPSFERTKVEAMVGWINKRFEHCLVVIGDSIHRNTLQINHDIGEEEATQQAHRMAQNVAEEYRDIFERSCNACHFEYVFCSEVQKKAEYQNYHDQLWALVDKNQHFAKSVRKFAEYFVKRRNVDLEEYFRLSSTYLLEELAIFTCLVKQGWPVFVYPGTFGILKEIADGEHPNVPDELQSLVNIGLELKVRGSV